MLGFLKKSYISLFIQVVLKGIEDCWSDWIGSAFLYAQFLQTQMHTCSAEIGVVQ